LEGLDLDTRYVKAGRSEKCLALSSLVAVVT